MLFDNIVQVLSLGQVDPKHVLSIMCDSIMYVSAIRDLCLQNTCVLWHKYLGAVSALICVNKFGICISDVQHLVW